VATSGRNVVDVGGNWAVNKAVDGASIEALKNGSFAFTIAKRLIYQDGVAMEPGGLYDIASQFAKVWVIEFRNGKAYGI